MLTDSQRERLLNIREGAEHGDTSTNAFLADVVIEIIGHIDRDKEEFRQFMSVLEATKLTDEETLQDS